MTTQQCEFIAPLASPLPPPPDGDVLLSSQWATLMAIGDAVVPAVEMSDNLSLDAQTLRSVDYTTMTNNLQRTLPAGIDKNLVHEYLAEKPSSIMGIKEQLHRILANYIKPDTRKGISLFLSMLDTRVGCLILTGSMTSFHLQPLNIRHRIIQGWFQSYFPFLRQTAKSLSFLLTSRWIQSSPSLGRMLGFPRAPVHGKPGKGFDYSFIQFAGGEEPVSIETDVVIVGSGCGAAVCAKNIAEDGHQVILLEKAFHFTPDHLPMSEADGGIHLFQNGGVEVTDDNSVLITAAQAFGGGGTVNWSASLQPQHFVRKEWADQGLPFFTSSEFQTSLDRVCNRMGVSSDHIEHNKTNRVLLDGAHKLGYNVKPVPQNTGGAKHYCGYCTMGCGSAEKQGPVVSFLPDAARAGAQFIEGFQAEKVLFEEEQGRKVAVGVSGIWRSRDSNGGVSGRDITVRSVTIKAKRVIVSGGTLQSPLLLLRSGLSNPQIGRNLHLHTAMIVGAIFPEEVRPWEGGILTTVISSLEDLDGHGHGVKIEATTMLPSMFLPLIPWTSGPEFKLRCSELKNTTGFVIIARDRDTGRVYPDPVDGSCRVAYTPSDFDRKSSLEGIIATAKICYIAGAKEIFTTTAGVSRFIRDPAPPSPPADPEKEGINNASFQSWLAEVRKKGLPSPEATFCCAHQMSSCRMGISQKNSVVDAKGKVWGVEGLYVADASVFPSASGVNPMVTNMAISDWISRGIARGLKGDGERLEAKV